MTASGVRPSVIPKAIKGFEHIKRFWEPKFSVIAAKILPGECYVSDRHEMITTVLGSCISACVRDPVAKVGGMNHFMLPIQSGTEGISRTAVMDPALCYGNWAMEYLLNAVMKLGGKKERMEVKIFGGGRVLSGMSNIDVGKQNIEFVLEFLEKERLKISAQDVGDIYPRKVLYFPDTGSVKVKKLKTDQRTAVTREVEQQEKRYLDSMAKPASTDIELF